MARSLPPPAMLNFPGASCNQLTKSSFENAKSVQRLMLSNQNREGKCGHADPSRFADGFRAFAGRQRAEQPADCLAEWIIWKACLPTGSNTTKADWQTVLDNGIVPRQPPAPGISGKSPAQARPAGTYAPQQCDRRLYSPPPVRLRR